MFNRDKDYPSEAEQLLETVRRHRPDAATWLDVACGTGHHLATLASWFDVAGVDISASMLAVARRHVGPRVPLYEASFTALQLNRTFDVVSCLFSSICHAETSRGLGLAVARMGSHLGTDGLLLVERYFAPEQFDDPRVGINHVTEGDLSASQYHVSRQDGTHAELHIHYVLARPGTVEHHDTRFDVGLFTDDDYARAFETAGLRHHMLLPDVLTARGVYVASRTPLAGRS